MHICAYKSVVNLCHPHIVAFEGMHMFINHGGGSEIPSSRLLYISVGHPADRRVLSGTLTRGGDAEGDSGGNSN